MRQCDSSEPRFPNRGWAGPYVKRGVSRLVSRIKHRIKSAPVKRPPSPEAMEALRKRFAKS